MYDIVTIEPDDATVKAAVDAIIRGNDVTSPKGGYRLIARNAVHTEGDGGKDSANLVIVGHGSADSLSGCRSFKDFVGYTLAAGVDWISGKKTVFVAACSTASEDGTKFLHGNMGNEIKAMFKDATVFASTVSVKASTLSGDWQKL